MTSRILCVLGVACAVLCQPCHVAADLQMRSAAALHGLGDPGEANGAAFGDLDADGWPDLFVARLGRSEPSLLYRNASGSFVLAQGRWTPSSRAMGGLFSDVDGDGDEDLYVVIHQGPNQLHLNNAGQLDLRPPPATYRESASATGVFFADLTEDGWTDAFTSHRRFSPNQIIGRFASDRQRDVSHLMSPLRAGVETFSASPIDFDSDGDLDVYVASFGGLNLLHANMGSGVFRTVPDGAGMDSRGFSVAALPADYDDDGDTDLYVLSGSEGANELYRNDQGHFTDVAAEARVAGEASSAGGAWADLDNDGDLDLLTTSLGQSVFLHRNDGGRFEQVPVQTVGDEALYTTGIAVADIDLDGDVDAYLAAPRLPDVLLVNDSTPAGNWIRLALTDASQAGARVTLEDAGGRQQRRTFAPASMLGSSDAGALHIGLGDADSARVSVTWPDGRQDDLGPVAGGSTISPVPHHSGADLAIEAVTSPALDYGWGVIVPTVTIRNHGDTPSMGLLRLTIVDPGGVAVEEEKRLSAIAPQQKTDVLFSPWEARLPGNHHFEIALVLDGVAVASDANTRRRRWQREQLLHPFADVAAEYGVEDGGHGWAGAFSDVDNDGDLDLYVSNGGTAGPDVNALYRNDAGHFSNVTVEAGAADNGNGTSVAFADFDRDGDQDLFLAKGGFDPLGQANRLLHNDGRGHFSDVSEANRIDRKASSYAAVLGDYDTDGFVDLYVTQLRGQDNRLYRNRGAHFEDVSNVRQILSFFRSSGSGGAFSDFDNDGDPDLYAGIFGDFDQLYDEDGSVSYSVRSVGDMGEHVGLALGDYDADADADVFVVNLNGRSVLYRNDLERLDLVDVGSESGTENQAIGTGCAFIDMDGDGDLDLLVSNLNSGTRLYVNEGRGWFVDQAQALGVDDRRPSRAVIVGDIDNDGDQDFYTINESGPNGLYRNGGIGLNGYLKVRVRGVRSNPDGIGARVYVEAAGRTLMREINGTAGSSYSERAAYFGLGRAAAIDSIWIAWPGGETDELGASPVNRTIQWSEGNSPTAISAVQAMPRSSRLLAVYPNPFNPSTQIRFSVGTPGHARLVIHNSLGQRVKLMVDEMMASGEYELVWDGSNAMGRPLASGVYLAQLRVNGTVIDTRRLLLLR